MATGPNPSPLLMFHALPAKRSPLDSEACHICKPLIRRPCAGSGSADGERPGVDSALACALLRQLLGCWAECTPGQLVDAPDAVACACMAAVLRCANLLLDAHRSLLPGRGGGLCRGFGCLSVMQVGDMVIGVYPDPPPLWAAESKPRCIRSTYMNRAHTCLCP
jgi:hypothetical protein